MRFARSSALLATAMAVAVPLAAAPLAGAPSTARAGEAFERPGDLRASELLPPDLLRGPHHQVEERVESDGLVPTYTVSSEFGRFEARGEAALRARIAEIEALAVLQESSESEDFAEAYARAGEPEAGSEPGRTLAVPGLPVGALPPRPARDASGPLAIEETKRRLAVELGIDPYTSNPELQRELERRAWAEVAGGLAGGLKRTEETDAEQTADHSERAAELLRDWSTEDLERLNRIELAAMGVDEPLREQFLEHPSYSPSTGTVLVESLSALEGAEDREAFIQAAVEAQSEDEARSFERMASLLRGFGESDGVDRIVTVDGQVAAFASDGTLVVPVAADHAIWSERVAAFAESLAEAAGSEPGVVKTRLLFSGTVSNRARSEIEDLGLDVSESAQDTPAP